MKRKNLKLVTNLLKTCLIYPRIDIVKALHAPPSESENDVSQYSAIFSAWHLLTLSLVTGMTFFDTRVPFEILIDFSFIGGVLQYKV